MSDCGPSITAARLYKKTSAKGTTYFVGRIGLVQVGAAPIERPRATTAARYGTSSTSRPTRSAGSTSSQRARNVQRRTNHSDPLSRRRGRCRTTPFRSRGSTNAQPHFPRERLSGSPREWWSQWPWFLWPYTQGRRRAYPSGASQHRRRAGSARCHLRQTTRCTRTSRLWLNLATSSNRFTSRIYQVAGERNQSRPFGKSDYAEPTFSTSAPPIEPSMTVPQYLGTPRRRMPRLR